MSEKCLAVITARAGSKGIPNKNLTPLAGKPLIQYTIEAAKNSKRISRTILSSDGEEIIAYAKGQGVEAPFIRPAHLSDDHADHVDVLLHTLDYLEQEGAIPTWLVLLQPTSPLRTAGDIDAAVEMAIANKADCVISVTEAMSHPYLAKKVEPDGRMQAFFPDIPKVSRRQDFPACYVPNGAVYVLSVAAFRQQRTLYMQNCFAYIMMLERSVDIDTMLDLQVASAFIT